MQNTYGHSPVNRSAK